MTTVQEQYLQLVRVGVTDDPHRALSDSLDLYDEILGMLGFSGENIDIKIQSGLFSLVFHSSSTDVDVVRAIRALYIAPVASGTAPLLLDVARIIADCLLARDCTHELRDDIARAIRILAIAYVDDVAEMSAVLAAAYELEEKWEDANREIHRALKTTSPDAHNYPTLVQMIWANLNQLGREDEIVAIINSLDHSTARKMEQLMPSMMKFYRLQAGQKGTEGSVRPMTTTMENWTTPNEL